MWCRHSHIVITQSNPGTGYQGVTIIYPWYHAFGLCFAFGKKTRFDKNSSLLQVGGDNTQSSITSKELAVVAGTCKVGTSCFACPQSRIACLINSVPKEIAC